MSNWIPISASQHASKHFLPRQGYSFSAGQQVIPILLADLSKLIPLYALGFIQLDNTYQACSGHLKLFKRVREEPGSQPGCLCCSDQGRRDREMVA